MMREGDTRQVFKWRGGRRRNCGRLSELYAVCSTLQRTTGCLSSSALIWDEEKVGRGTLNLAAGERQEVFYYPLSVADGGSMQEIRIKAAVLSLLVDGTQL